MGKHGISLVEAPWHFQIRVEDLGPAYQGLPYILGPW
jgi:hypothetical protein